MFVQFMPDFVTNRCCRRQWGSLYSLLGLIVWMSASSADRSGADAADHYLTIGGGYDATGNQLSLETNVRYLQDLLQLPGRPAPVHDVYFADGSDKRRDLQFRPSGMPVPIANRWMARLFGNEKHLGLAYRDHELSNVRGAATRQNLVNWFGEEGQHLRPGDRLILYATAHGGRGRDDKQPGANRLYLWQSPSLSVSELADQLQHLPAEVPVILVMVQCYAGGFGHVLFHEGNPEKGDLDRSICGFFATTHDRPAAGCTADSEGDFTEYSGAFWAALSGITRSGQPARPADYDNDGRVSLAEAHAFAILATESLDIPIKTSDTWLRVHSSFSDTDTDGLLTDNPPFELLVERADRPEQIVLTTLEAELDLPADAKVAAARRQANQIQGQRQGLAKEDRQLKQRQSRLRRKIVTALKQEWPELANPWNPTSIQLVAQQADTLVHTIESHSNHAPLEKVRQRRKEIAQRRFDLEKKYAQYRRFVQVCESVALAVNLQVRGNSDTLQRYRRLTDAEAASLHW